MSSPDAEFAFAEVATEPDGEGAEIFHSLTRAVGARSLGVSRLELQPGGRMRVHRHERQEELYFVLSGTLTLIVEGEEQEIPTGSLARVGPSAKRQVANRGEVPVVVLALGAAGDHVARDAVAWHSWEEDGPGHPPRDVPYPPDFEDQGVGRG